MANRGTLHVFAAVNICTSSSFSSSLQLPLWRLASDTKHLLFLYVSFNGRDARALVDSGASQDFISERFVVLDNMRTFKCSKSFIRFGNGQSQLSKRYIRNGSVKVGGQSTRFEGRVLNMGTNEDIDIILGRPWQISYLAFCFGIPASFRGALQMVLAGKACFLILVNTNFQMRNGWLVSMLYSLIRIHPLPI